MAAKPPAASANRKPLIGAYGDETDDWHGQPIEVYADLNVTNSRGEVVGGVRVRIPAATTRHASAPRPAVAPPTPTARNGHAAPPPVAKPAVPTAVQAHAKTLAGLRAATTIANADEWLAWGAKNPRTLVQRQEQEATRNLALERIAPSEAPAAEPEFAGVEDDIPF